MDVLTNPYFLGYLLVVLLLVRLGNALRDMAKENAARRERARAERRRMIDADV